MKKAFLLLLSVSVLFSCSDSGKKDGNENGAACTINGTYSSAADGTVLYMTPIDDILAPLDSAVVKGGCFSFTSSDSAIAVRFISSQQVIDGNFVVLEPGVVKVDFTGEKFASGTSSNDRLSRFMSERTKIVNLRRLCKPESLDMLGLDEAMRDSINDVKDFANVAYEAYVIKEIKENIKTPLGYLFLVQSVGIVSSAKLHPMFDKVPVEFRDKLYDVMKRRVETEVSDAAIYDKYHDEMLKSLEATSVGKIFQNFELNNINGGRVLLSDEVFANKYTLVFFWSGWMEDIKEQVKALSKAYGTSRNKGLQIVGVSLDGNVDDCKALADELDIRWVQLCNPSGGSAEVAAAYGITELPAAILVNKRGTILARLSNVSEIIKKIEELF